MYLNLLHAAEASICSDVIRVSNCVISRIKELIITQGGKNIAPVLVYLKLDDEGSMASSFSPSKLRRYSEVDIEGRISALFALNLELSPAKVKKFII